MIDRMPNQRVLEVIRVEWLTPGMVRIIAGGDGFDAFPDTEFTDKYVKISFAKAELGLTPPYDVAALREQLAPEDLPVTRTYTVRWVDEAASELAIDFVVHGDEGLAGPWAASAQPGDALVLSGPGGGYAPDQDADWHLFAGDESAVPAIASALESLPSTARGHAYLSIRDGADRQELLAPADVRLHWLVDPDASSRPELLADAIAAGEWADGLVQVFAHGERESMKALRRLLAAHEVPRERLSLSGYWAHGRTEDRFQAEKREPIGKID
jgi:NADPH-dependent ferric siderophore reductase